MRILVALKPRACRDALVHVIQRARPQLAVHFLDPDILDYETRYLEPQVVICDRITPAVREYAICWVEILQHENTQAVITIKGQAKIVSDISLGQLISVIDQAEVLARSRADTETVHALL